MDKLSAEKSNSASFFSQRFILNIFFSGILVICLFINLITYLQLDKFVTAYNWITHTYQVINTNNDMLLGMLEIESITRGYVISNDKTLIEGLDEKINKMYASYDILTTQTKDNPKRQKALELLKKSLDERMILIKETVAFKKRSPIPPEQWRELILHAQTLTNKIKLAVDNINEEEIQLLVHREEELLHKINITISITTIASTTNLLVLIAILFFFNRLLSNLKKSEDEIKRTSKKLTFSFNKLKNQTKELSLINEMNNALETSSSMPETLSMISLYSKKLLPFTAGILYLQNASANQLEATTEWNHPKLKRKIFTPQQCFGLRHGKMYSYISQEESIPCEHFENTNNLSPYFCVPLLAQNEVIGLLYLEVTKSSIPENKIHHIIKTYNILIINLAAQIALSISNMKLQNILKTRSTRDPLTNLYNRTYLNETLDRDIQRAKRKDISLAIVMMDLDLFKNVNDKYGHEAGDLVLREIGKLLLDKVRKGDIACRYGGDEFLLVFYDTSLEDALKRIEQLRSMISEMPFMHNGISFQVAASFGIAMYPKDESENFLKLIAAADKALYQTKRAGRNKVMVYNKDFEYDDTNQDKTPKT